MPPMPENACSGTSSYTPSQMRVKASDGLVGRHVGAGATGELLSHIEVLAEELLDLTSTVHGGLVLFAELVDTDQAMMSCSSLLRCRIALTRLAQS